MNRVGKQLTPAETDDVRHGRRIGSDDRHLDPVAAFAPTGELVALLDQSGRQPRSHVVFAG